MYIFDAVVMVVFSPCYIIFGCSCKCSWFAVQNILFLSWFHAFFALFLQTPFKTKDLDIMPFQNNGCASPFHLYNSQQHWEANHTSDWVADWIETQMNKSGKSVKWKFSISFGLFVVFEFSVIFESLHHFTEPSRPCWYWRGIDKLFNIAFGVYNSPIFGAGSDGWS